MFNKKKIIVALLVSSLLGIGVYSQSRGTPSQIRVILDSLGSLVVSSSAATPPYTSVQFSNARLLLDSNGALVVTASGSGSGFAPSDATYITKTPNSSLSAEEALSTLNTGLMFSTTTTGVVTTKVPTDDNILIGNGTDWQLKAFTSCSAASSALTYNTTTNALGCNTISGFSVPAGWSWDAAALTAPTSGVISTGDGSLGDPSYSFTNGEGTGFYLALDQLSSYGPTIKISVPGIYSPTLTASAVAGMAGSVTVGVHEIYQTHVTNEGETTPFLIATFDSVDNRVIEVSGFDAGFESVVTSNNIYMTAAGVTGATNSHFVGSTGDSTTENYNIDIDDASLIGGDAPPTVNTTTVNALEIQGGNVGRIVPHPLNSYNIAIGLDTLYAVREDSNSSHNIAIDLDALYQLIDGSSNIAIGESALSNLIEGNENVAIGSNALAFATTYNNTAVGSGAGGTITTGDSNTAIGYTAGPLTGGLSATISIGAGARATASDTAVIGQSSLTDVYFGSVTPTAAAHAAAYIAETTTPSVDNIGANSCGTSAASITGPDNAPVITTGATAWTACRVTFDTVAPNGWNCTWSNKSTHTLAATPYQSGDSTTTADVSASSLGVAADILTGTCFAR